MKNAFVAIGGTLTSTVVPKRFDAQQKILYRLLTESIEIRCLENDAWNGDPIWLTVNSELSNEDAERVFQAAMWLCTQHSENIRLDWMRINPEGTWLITISARMDLASLSEFQRVLVE